VHGFEQVVERDHEVDVLGRARRAVHRHRDPAADGIADAAIAWSSSTRFTASLPQ
jgi:hypothetical protein